MVIQQRWISRDVYNVGILADWPADMYIRLELAHLGAQMLTMYIYNLSASDSYS